jgi:hypothetical protein
MSDVFTIPGQGRPVRFTGTLLAEESTETQNSLRWLELSLYRVDEGDKAGQYLLHRVGQSIVFHRPDACGYGVPTEWSKVPADAEPCATCQPIEPFLEGPDAKYQVWLESPRHKVIVCSSASDLERALMMKRKDGSQFLSTPASNLLLKAREKDLNIGMYFGTPMEL